VPRALCYHGVVRALLCLWLAGCGFQESGNSHDAGTPTKCPSFGAFGNFYCDGFESGLNPAYLLTQVNGTVEISQDRGYRGVSSLHLHTDAYDGGLQSYVQASVYGDDSGPIHFAESGALRVFVYLPSPVVDGGLPLMVFGDTVVTLNSGVPELISHRATMALPTDRWVCVELRSQSTATGNDISLYFDDQPVAQDSMAGGSNIHGFGLQLVRTQQVTPPLDVWFDELAVNDAPIYCDR
jgi:hypothetical protein